MFMDHLWIHFVTVLECFYQNLELFGCREFESLRNQMAGDMMQSTASHNDGQTET